MAEKLVRYVELVRVSSTGQAERDTPEDQRRALDRLALSRSGRLVERIEHGARGLSGAAGLDDRPDLQRLAELSRARAYDELRVRHLDRLTRHADPRERFAIFGMVQEAGAVIVDAGGSVIDPADPSGSGEVSYFLQTWMSAQEKRRIRERTIEGRRRKLAAGDIIASMPWARRFDKATKTWTVDERAAALYRRLFSEVLSGVTAGRLAEKLNEEGHPTPRGGRWSASRVTDLIHSEGAVGRIQQAGEVIECPPIVDEETWQKARARLSSNACLRRGRPGSVPALLRGIATCATCGATMYVNTGGTRGKQSAYYVCGSVQRDRIGAEPACRAWHRAPDVDAKVREELLAFLADPSRLLAAVQDDNGPAQEGDDVAEVEREISDLASRQEKLVRLATKGLVPDDVAEKQLAEVGRLRVAAEKRLATARGAQDALRRAQDDRDGVEAAVAALRLAVETEATDEAYRKVLLSLFPRGEGASIRIQQDGTIDARGLVALGANDAALAQPQSLRTERPIIIRCTSLVPSPISQSLASR